MKYVIAAVIGAVIGYVTNWLAIKMLFRPYEEIRFFGIKMPFTPGLIPKERLRLSKSVGQSVGNHLLTKESIVEALDNEEIRSRLNGWARFRIKSTVERNETLSIILQKALKEKYNGAVQSFKENLSNYLVRIFLREDLKKKAAELVGEEVRKVIQVNPETLFNTNAYKVIRCGVVNQLDKLKGSSGIRSHFLEIVREKITKLGTSDKKILELIPETITEALKEHIVNNSSGIAAYIKDSINKTGVQEKIRSSITEMISGLNPMLAMFINADMILDKLTEYIMNYLDDEVNQEGIVQFINNSIDKLGQEKASRVLNSFSDDEKVLITNSLSKIIFENIFQEEAIDKCILIFENSLASYKSIGEAIDYNKIISKSTIQSLVNSAVDSLLSSPRLVFALRQVVNHMVDSILCCSVKDVIDYDEEELLKASSNVIESVYSSFIKNKAVDLVECIDVSKIVEDKMNSFDVAFAEKLVVEIAHKELSAITWLGALLGGIIGILSPLLSALY